MKMYRVTKHAIDRAVERLGVSAEYATNHLIQLMQTAYYNGSTPHPNGKRHKVFDHYKTRTRVIVSEDDSIITVYKLPEENALTIPSFLRPVVEREFRRVRREVTRLTRRHEEAIGKLTVEMGERIWARARAKNPNTREMIQAEIDEIQAKINGHLAAIEREQMRIEDFEKVTGVYA
ncbi:hypothetical protein [Lederbergia citri]|uniref:Uncharacterized protein n=1 Tax=Lederbergia citri TaxID=2833580 RepID=A0A942TCP5_9BACI|nr:hypothetical protein [Lederbergia citri]MBS4195375.1 hypothetical protein [Lederbergia citri]